MAVVTKIDQQKRSPGRRSVFLDGKFAFGCGLNVVAKFKLREGMALSSDEVEAIKQGEVRQECLDDALKALGRRLHSRNELARKLMKQEYGEDVVAGVLDELQRMGYVDDERFAKTRALSAAQYKHHGRRRAMVELMKSGVGPDVAKKALDDVYETTDSTALARELARKHAARLKKLDPLAARRRLVGMLQRRGFDYEAIRPVLDEVLGKGDE